MCRGTKDNKFSDPEDAFEGGPSIINEVQEIITLPRFSQKEAEQMPDPNSLELGEDVVNQLHDYVSTVASLYRVCTSNRFCIGILLLVRATL